ncbi:MAG: hypothetical protein QOD61_1148 [Solirubrobacteraceae bacterium]|nr:hypothetical protein [Solirubrobacteraceae bacterium]
MTLTHQKSALVAHARTRIAVLVLVLSLLTAASAAAAAPTATAPAAPAAADPSTQPAASPAPAPDPAASVGPAASAPAPAAAAPTGGTPSDPSADSASAASPLATEPVTQQPTPGATLQPQQVVIAAGSATTPIEHPTRDPSGPSTGHASPDQPVVSTTRPPAPAVRATVTQLASGGPFVAASSAAAAQPATPQPTHGDGAQAQQVVLADGGPAPRGAGVRPPAPLVSIAAMSLPVVGVYIGRATSPRHADAKTSQGSVEPQVGPSGLTATSSSPFGSGSFDHPGGAALLGNAPFSSPGGSVPLLGLNAMLAAVTLLAGLTWRRRSWDLPVLRGESALLASALDRPG